MRYSITDTYGNSINSKADPVTIARLHTLELELVACVTPADCAQAPLHSVGHWV